MIFVSDGNYTDFHSCGSYHDRGGGTLAPENTLGALRHGASLGFLGVEFDVMRASCRARTCVDSLRV